MWIMGPADAVTAWSLWRTTRSSRRILPRSSPWRSVKPARENPTTLTMATCPRVSLPPVASLVIPFHSLGVCSFFLNNPPGGLFRKPLGPGQGVCCLLFLCVCVILFQDSFQPQPQEMLLNPGSRLARNARLTQSTGELEGVGYPARSPQRDFNTLPPYHDPPTFEEAMRQSGRKPRTRKSTGDLTDGRSTADNPGRQSGRRARPSRPVDDPTDSSDAEPRYRRRPTPAVRALDSDDEPRYASGHTRRAPPIPAAGVEPRGAPDPEVPYAKPIKKPKPARVMRAEPAIGTVQESTLSWFRLQFDCSEGCFATFCSFVAPTRPCFPFNLCCHSNSVHSLDWKGNLRTYYSSWVLEQ